MLIWYLLFFCSIPPVFYLLERQDLFHRLKLALQTRTISTGILNYGDMGAILKELGFVRLVENDETRFHRSNKQGEDDENSLELIPFQKKRRVDSFLYAVNPVGRTGMLREFFPNGLVEKKGWPVLSIKVPESDLNDPEKGLLEHRDQRGQEWERKAEMLLVKDGDVLLYSTVGLRMHGGKRRLSKHLPDYRLYFRKKYGIEAIPSGTLPGLDIPVFTLVVKNLDWPEGYPMNTPLAFDLSERIGAIVPESSLVELYVNGKSVGMAYVTEHLSRRQWNQRIKHHDYMYYKYKSDNLFSDKKIFTKNFWVAAQKRSDFGMSSVGASIDLDNFTRHIFSSVFNGTTDNCQGVAIFDLKNSSAKMQWINWDMDHSFFDLKAQSQNLERENWEQEGFRLVYSSHGTNCDRHVLFSRLINESSEYRSYFINIVSEILNHKLNREFLLSRVEYYQKMLGNYGDPRADYIIMLKKYMDNRSMFLRQEMLKELNLKKIFSCKIKNLSRSPIKVDGYIYYKDFTGSYFKGQKVIVDLDKNSKKIFLYWLVNGQRIANHHFEFIIEDDTTIQAVYKN